MLSLCREPELRKAAVVFLWKSPLCSDDKESGYVGRSEGKGSGVNEMCHASSSWFFFTWSDILVAFEKGSKIEKSKKKKNWYLYYFARAAITKYHKWGGLEQEKLMVSQFWRPDVWNQCVSRAMLPLKVLGENLFQPFLLPSSSSLACGYITLIFTWYSPTCLSLSNFPLFIGVPVILDFYKDQSF